MEITGNLDTSALDRSAHFQEQPMIDLDGTMLMMDVTGSVESAPPKPRSAHFQEQPILNNTEPSPVKFDNGGMDRSGDDWSTSSTYISKEDAHDLLKSSGYRSPTKRQETRLSAEFNRSKILENTGFMIGQQNMTGDKIPKKDAQAQWRAQLEADQQLAPVDINIGRKQHMRMIDTPFGQRRAQADATRTVMGMSPTDFQKRGEMIRQQLRHNRMDVAAALSTSKSALSLAQMRKVQNGVGGQDISDILAEEQYYSVPRYTNIIT